MPSYRTVRHARARASVSPHNGVDVVTATAPPLTRNNPVVMPNRWTSSLTASSQILDPQVVKPRTNEEWQLELWDFYHNLGEFNFATTWFAEGMSRIRLTAAYNKSGGDEPSVITEGPAAEAVSQLGYGIGGQSEMMRELAIQYSVPGDCYLIGEDDPLHVKTWAWRIYSIEEVRTQKSRRSGVGAQKQVWEVREDEAVWRTLGPNSLVVRVWQPDPQAHWRAMSSARSGLGAMRTLDLLNRRVISQVLSRLAGNGFLLYPDEITFSVPDQFKDAPDPFIAQIVDIASKSVENPGAPSSAIPFPLRVPSEFLDKIQHLTISNELDEKLTEYREYEIRRLATTLRIPGEILLGRGDINHWGMWQLEEESIKLYFSTAAELFCTALTRGFLWPTLKAMGVPIQDDNGEVIIWYDTSELSSTPDKSGNAQALYNLGELGPMSLRRESGFSESDKPTEEELNEMILKKIVFGSGAALDNLVISSVDMLTGMNLESSDPETVNVAESDPGEEDEPDINIEEERETPSRAITTDVPNDSETRGTPSTQSAPSPRSSSRAVPSR